MRISDTIIAYHYTPGESNREAALLASNLKQWGDRFKYMLHWIFELAPASRENKNTLSSDDSECFTSFPPDEIASFPFAAKVFAAAEAEAMADQAQAPQLIWMDPDSLILQEPAALLLSAQTKIAVSPVQLKNISSCVDQPPDDFWKLIYTRCEVPKKKLFNLYSSVDRQYIRAHFNAGLISVNPKFGLLQKWRDNFLSLYRDPVFEAFYQKDIRYQYFFHQAVLAGTILSTCDQKEITLLPAAYNFPLHLVKQMEMNHRPVRLNDLVTARYDRFDLPGWPTMLRVDEPLKSWLSDAVAKASLVLRPT